MAINQLFNGLSIPGSIVTMNEQLNPSGTYFIVNEELADADVYPWGVLLLRVFVPPPVAKTSTVFSLDLFTNSYALFQPFTQIGTVPVQFGLYSGVRSKVFEFSLYEEV